MYVDIISHIYNVTVHKMSAQELVWDKELHFVEIMQRHELCHLKV